MLGHASRSSLLCAVRVIAMSCLRETVVELGGQRENLSKRDPLEHKAARSTLYRRSRWLGITINSSSWDEPR